MSAAVATGEPQDSDTAGSGRRLLPVADGRRTRSWALSRLRRRPVQLAATVAAMAVAAACGLAGPLATGRIVQALTSGQGPHAVVGPAVGLGVAVVVGAASVVASGRLLARLVLPVVAELREEVVAAAVTLPVDVAEAGGAGDLVARVCEDVEQLTEAASGALGNFVAAALAITAAFVGLLALDWRFLVAALIAVPVQLGTLRWYLRASRPVYAAGRIADGRRTAALLAAFAALPTIRALRIAPAQYETVAERSVSSSEYQIRATRLATRFYGRLNGAEFLGLAAILAVAAQLIRDGAVTPGAATSAALFFVGLFGPINVALGVFDDLQRAGAGLARLLGVRDLGSEASQTSDPAAQPQPHPQPSPSAEARIRLQDVTFRYGPPGTRDAVTEVSLDIEAGYCVAVVGVSGSGKTTLAGLIAGLHHPTAGTLSTGGSRIALAAQQPHVFAGTVTEDLRLAAPSATPEQVRAALERTGAADWVDALPQGPDTLVGAGGHALTPGQAQHLALTRLLLLDPAFVILDEATAEGGSEAARVLDESARTVIAGRGALVIAHRLSQAEHASRIAVMADGRVAEYGTHAELLAAEGDYARLWQAWSQHG